jgi:hypothetical protein
VFVSRCCTLSYVQHQDLHLNMVCYVAAPENASKETMDVAIKLGLFYSFLNPEKVPVHSNLLPCYFHARIMR